MYSIDRLQSQIDRNPIVVLAVAQKGNYTISIRIPKKLYSVYAEGGSVTHPPHRAIVEDGI